MPLTLGDAFSRRKQIESEIQTWISRLNLAGMDTKTYQTKKIDGEDKFKPIPGTKKDFLRNYTIDECRNKIDELIKEDQKLAIRISITNQKAKAKIIDLNGIEKELTIPELLVLKNDIAPKLERTAQAIPKLRKGVEVIEKADNYIKWRIVSPKYKIKQSLSDQGHKIENEYIDYYDVQENIDYGIAEREVFDEIDKIHAWQHRLKEAINDANKTELIDL
ncbi:MAG: hypothetical protein EAX96_17770 [Candidatus Lokiarchaeota archaeon]|nr:hypothetical protein [Candidatus Lokiarchaeota archaeon]